MLSSTDDFNSLIARAGLENAGALLRERARHGFHIVCLERAMQALVGATRFGGMPDLPEGVDWPATDDGACTFYGQINLADVVRPEQSSMLPIGGLLSFFAGGIEGSTSPVAARVIYTPPGASLTRRAGADFADGCELLQAVEAKFVPAMTLPLDDLDFLDAVAASAPGGNVDALTDAVIVRPDDTIGMLLGNAITLQHNLQAAIAFDALDRSGQDNLAQWRTWPDWEAAKRIEHLLAGGGIYRPWSSDDDDNVRWIQANRAKVQAEINAWAQLLRIDSNRGMDLWINDADPLYFFAREKAITDADFTDVRARATQS